jgi:hypothetical protein
LSDEQLDKIEKQQKQSKTQTKPLSEEEKKEIRRRQQERALQFQKKVDEELKNDQTIIKEEQEEQEQDDVSSDEEAENINYNINNETDNNTNDTKSSRAEQLKLINELETKQYESIIKNQKNLNEQKTSQPEDVTYGKFYFEDLLKEYEKTVNRDNNEMIGKMIQNTIDMNKLKLEQVTNNNLQSKQKAF